MEETLEKTLGRRFNDWSTGFFKIATPIAFVTIAFTIGRVSNEMKSVTFTSPEQKQEVLERIKSLPSVIQLNNLNDHVSSKGVHMPREAKDSIYVTRMENNEIIKNNAIDIYNVKRGQDKINTKLDETNRTLKAIHYKLDEIARKQ